MTIHDALQEATDNLNTVSNELAPVNEELERITGLLDDGEEIEPAQLLLDLLSVHEHVGNAIDLLGTG